LLSSTIQQLELSSDEITRNASRVNGTGPTSFKDLESIGYTVIYTLNGFYVVKFNDRIMKIVYCNYIELMRYTTINFSKMKDFKPESKNNTIYLSENIRNLKPTATTQQTKTSKSGNKSENLSSKLPLFVDTVTF